MLRLNKPFILITFLLINILLPSCICKQTPEKLEEKLIVRSGTSTATDGPIKEKSKRKRDLLGLPTELLEEIVSYLSYKDAMSIRQLNRYFYSLITGYRQVGKVGVKNKPDQSIAQTKWSSIKQLNFSKLTHKLNSMPSFIFYQFLKEVRDLPPIYWPHLAETQVHTVDLFLNKIGCKGIEQLGGYLQNSKVHTVLLCSNQIKYKGAEEFGKSLAVNKNIREIDLSDNQLQAAGAKGLTALLSNQVHILHLRNNDMKAAGAIEVARNIQNTAVEAIDLQINHIGDAGVIGIIENLQGSLLKKLYLGGNQITDEGVVEMADKLKNNILEEFSLAGNKITSKGALAFVKGCRGTKIQKINLSYNKGITDAGVLEIVKELEGTELKEIGLRPLNLLKRETQAFLREQYSHIRWIFS
jgi:Ran GTPase-activating protein (RanGAP) involved in mRNA processing and transport